MSRKEKLLPASFRGVPFNLRDDEATFGRRTQTHEFPGRDKPWTEDLGRTPRRDTISAYLIGDDYRAQRDRLIAAVSQAGPGRLVHPQYGEVMVCTDGEIRVSHSASAGRMCTVSFNFVEAGELSFPVSGVATGRKLAASCDAMTGCAAETFSQSFGLKGMPGFVQDAVIAEAADMLNTAAGAFDGTRAGIAEAGRLLAGDVSVLLMPPASGMNFVNRLQRLWRSGDGLLHDSDDIMIKINGLTGITAGHSLAPRGVWETDSITVQTQTRQRNALAQAVRTTALAEAARAVSDLPQARPPVTATPPGQLPFITHPAVTSLNDTATLSPPVTYEAMKAIRDRLNPAFERESARVRDDALFLTMNTVRADVNNDISVRLEQSGKTTVRTPDEVLPALVLAADWYDSAARETDITGRNRVRHPGFVAASALRVPVK